MAVYVEHADKQYVQDDHGWIEVQVLPSEENAVLTITFVFREQAFLKQLQFEGNSQVL